MPETAQVVIVGAGLAGLTAGRALAAAGVDAVIVDKGRSVGGRLATRRIGTATLDHGAQFFTVRSDGFAAVVAEAEAAGVVYEWCRGFDAEPDGYPRYAASGGMNQLAKYFAKDLRLLLNTRIDSAAIEGGRWVLSHAAGTVEGHALLLTAPMPQNLAILRAGEVALDENLNARLESVTYHPTLALLAVLDGQSGVPDPGGRQLISGPFSFVSDNYSKGISERVALTGHLNHDLTREHWALEDSEILSHMLESAAPWFGTAEVVDAQVKRWRYAGPVIPSEREIESDLIDGLPLVFAGDAFGGAKVEGAYRSGRAAGDELLELIASAL
ncbi:MAG: NAD(P)/FAD-dependent oxidoreductase [Verrucomicrobiales bacterium]